MTEQLNTEQETTLPEQAETPTQPTGISPLLVIFLISGVMGLVTAGVILLADDSSEDLTQGPTSSQLLREYTPAPQRSLNDWRAEDFQLTSLTGDTVSLSDYEGRMVFINFWRTDCAPCVRELPAFRDFMAQQGADGAIVLAVNQGEDAAMIAEFLESIDIDAWNDFPVLLDEDMTVSVTYPSQFLPTTYVVNSEGMVQNFRIGEMTVDEMNGYLETDPNFRSDAAASQG